MPASGWHNNRHTTKEVPDMAAIAQRAENPTVLDVEASGFGRNSYPIEIGFVLPDGHSYCTLVRPEPHWTHWDTQAQALHHIPRAIVQERGLPVDTVARKLNTDLRGQTVYSDGWANDYTWLNALFDAADMTPSFRLENLRALLNEQEADQWHLVKAQISSERGAQRHRASADARLLQLTLQRLRGIPHHHKDTP
jgi:hypothetical protein